MFHTVITWYVERLRCLPMLLYVSTSNLNGVPAFPCEMWSETIFPDPPGDIESETCYHTMPKPPLFGSVA